TNYDIFLLEYDDERSGSFAALGDVPDDKVVVLGLVSSKFGTMEPADQLAARIREASGFFPREQLALSTQCGFASAGPGNQISEDAQENKLRLVAEVADRGWGERARAGRGLFTDRVIGGNGARTGDGRAGCPSAGRRMAGGTQAGGRTEPGCLPGPRSRRRDGGAEVLRPGRGPDRGRRAGHPGGPRPGLADAGLAGHRDDPRWRGLGAAGVRGRPAA